MNLKDIDRRIAALEEAAQETDDDPVIVRFAVMGDPEENLTEWPHYRRTRKGIEHFDQPEDGG
jgi:hypothetical protein